MTMTNNDENDDDDYNDGDGDDDDDDASWQRPVGDEKSRVLKAPSSAAGGCSFFVASYLAHCWKLGQQTALTGRVAAWETNQLNSRAAITSLWRHTPQRLLATSIPQHGMSVYNFAHMCDTIEFAVNPFWLVRSRSYTSHSSRAWSMNYQGTPWTSVSTRMTRN